MPRLAVMSAFVLLSTYVATAVPAVGKTEPYTVPFSLEDGSTQSICHTFKKLLEHLVNKPVAHDLTSYVSEVQIPKGAVFTQLHKPNWKSVPVEEVLPFLGDFTLSWFNTRADIIVGREGLIVQMAWIDINSDEKPDPVFRYNFDGHVNSWRILIGDKDFRIQESPWCIPKCQNMVRGFNIDEGISGSADIILADKAYMIRSATGRIAADTLMIYSFDADNLAPATEVCKFVYDNKFFQRYMQQRAEKYSLNK